MGGRGPAFTREPLNLVQRDSRRYSGYLQKAVGVSSRRPAALNQPKQFAILKKKAKFARKPRGQRGEDVFEMGCSEEVVRNVDVLTRYRMHRGDLAKMAKKRVFKIKETRLRYNAWLKKEAYLDALYADYSDSEDEDGNVRNEDLVEVD